MILQRQIYANFTGSNGNCFNYKAFCSYKKWINGPKPTSFQSAYVSILSLRKNFVDNFIHLLEIQL